MAGELDRVRVRLSRPADLGRVCEMLKSANLPTEGVSIHFPSFLIAEKDGKILGAMGLEIYGETALLRSTVVDKAFRGAGIGSLLWTHTRRLAKERGVTSLLLLTETAERFFHTHGFRRLDRSRVSGQVTLSAEFTGACPSSAVCMMLDLQ
jgi:amino-acid N-acetyltransferase